MSDPVQSAPDPSGIPGPVSIEILAGDPTAAELAAITAIIGAMAEEQDDRDERTGDASSAWERNRHVVRSPLYPGLGAWRGFDG